MSTNLTGETRLVRSSTLRRVRSDRKAAVTLDFFYLGSVEIRTESKVTFRCPASNTFVCMIWLALVESGCCENFSSNERMYSLDQCKRTITRVSSVRVGCSESRSVQEDDSGVGG